MATPTMHSNIANQVRLGRRSLRMIQESTAAINGELASIISTLPALVYWLPSTKPQVVRLNSSATAIPVQPQRR